MPHKLQQLGNIPRGFASSVAPLQEFIRYDLIKGHEPAACIIAIFVQQSTRELQLTQGRGQIGVIKLAYIASLAGDLRASVGRRDDARDQQDPFCWRPVWALIYVVFNPLKKLHSFVG